MKNTFKRKPFGPTLKYNQIPRQNPHLKKKKKKKKKKKIYFF